MNRFVSFAAAGLAATSLLAACGGSTTPAATVNGIEISQQDLVDELEAIEGNADYLAAYEASATQSGQPPIRGSEEGTFDTAFVATTLGVRIQYALVEAEVDRRGIDIGGDCKAAAREQVVTRFAGASVDGDGTAVLEAFGDTYAGYLVDRETDFLALQADIAEQPCAAEPGDDVVEAYFDENRDQFAAETACVSHILVDTLVEAQEIQGLLAAGGDFAQLATERSNDPGSGAEGGELGCSPAGRFVAEFDAAAFSLPVGQVSDPVQTEFGFHLILVTSRGTPEFDDVRSDVEAALAQEVETAFFAWFEEALATAEVTVDRRYGTWDPTTATITRPSSEPETTATTAAEE